MYDSLDMSHALSECKFVAVNLDNLPKYGPEELNPAVVVERQVRTEANVKELANTVTQLSYQSATDESASFQKLEMMLNEMKQKLDSFQSVCASHGNLSPAPTRVTARNGPIDRASNTVVYGVKEDRDMSAWRSDVDTVLQYVVGHTVDVVDMFRLGRFAPNSSRPRPILVKLRVAWDKRIILSNSRSLKQFRQGEVFIAPDEPLEVRRAKTLDRLKSSGVKAGKSATVTDGVLVIDGVEVFSLSNGFIHRNDGV